MEAPQSIDEAQQQIAVALDALLEGSLPGSLDPVNRLAQLLEWLRLTARIDAVLLDVVGAMNADGDSEAVTDCSLRTWLALTRHMTMRDAGVLIARSSRRGECGRIADAQSAGSMSASQADAASAAVTQLPDDLGPDQRDRAEQAMIEFAEDFGPKELRDLGRHLVHVVAPEIAEAEDAARVERDYRHALKHRVMTWSNDGHGSVHFRARLPEVDAQSLIGVVDAVAHRAHRTADHLRGADTEEDRSPSFAQRRADALLDLVAHVHTCRAAPTHGGDRPRLLVSITEESLRERLHRRDKYPADASASYSPEGSRPTGSAKAQLSSTDDRVPVGILRSLACDAEVLPMVLGGAGQVLDVGRAQRLVTTAIRVALTMRDGGCVMPGCDQPPEHCEAHHVIPWQCGGPTALDNLALLCRSHHRLLEPQPNAPPGTRWEIQINTDGMPEVLPPRHLDPWRRARLHPRHQLKKIAESRGGTD